MKYCGTCKRRNTCKKLCAQNERWVNKYVRNAPFETLIASVLPTTECIQYGNPDKSDKRLAVELYYLDGKSIDEICYHVELSPRMLRYMIDRIELERSKLGKYSLMNKILTCYLDRKIENMSEIANICKTYPLKVKRLIDDFLQKCGIS